MIDLSKASHRCTKMWWEGDDLLGEFEILDTPNGKVLEQYITQTGDSDCMVTCGTGDVDSKGNVSHYELLGINFEIKGNLK